MSVMMQEVTAPMKTKAAKVWTGMPEYEFDSLPDSLTFTANTEFDWLASGPLAVASQDDDSISVDTTNIEQCDMSVLPVADAFTAFDTPSGPVRMVLPEGVVMQLHTTKPSDVSPQWYQSLDQPAPASAHHVFTPTLPVPNLEKGSPTFAVSVSAVRPHHVVECGLGDASTRSLAEAIAADLAQRHTQSGITIEHSSKFRRVVEKGDLGSWSCWRVSARSVAGDFCFSVVWGQRKFLPPAGITAQELVVVGMLPPVPETLRDDTELAKDRTSLQDLLEGAEWRFNDKLLLPPTATTTTSAASRRPGRPTSTPSRPTPAASKTVSSRFSRTTATASSQPQPTRVPYQPFFVKPLETGKDRSEVASFGVHHLDLVSKALDTLLVPLDAMAQFRGMGLSAVTWQPYGEAFCQAVLAVVELELAGKGHKLDLSNAAINPFATVLPMLLAPLAPLLAHPVTPPHPGIAFVSNVTGSDPRPAEECSNPAITVWARSVSRYLFYVLSTGAVNGAVDLETVVLMALGQKRKRIEFPPLPSTTAATTTTTAAPAAPAPVPGTAAAIRAARRARADSRTAANNASSATTSAGSKGSGEALLLPSAGMLATSSANVRALFQRVVDFFVFGGCCVVGGGRVAVMDVAVSGYDDVALGERVDIVAERPLELELQVNEEATSWLLSRSSGEYLVAVLGRSGFEKFVTCLESSSRVSLALKTQARQTLAALEKEETARNQQPTPQPQPQPQAQ